MDKSIYKENSRDVNIRPAKSGINLTQVVLYLILISGAIIAILPFFWMVSTSFMTLGETINRQWIPRALQFENYAEAWVNAKFANYFMNSIIITIVTIVGLLFTSILAAYSFASIRFPGRNLLFALLLSTMMIPDSVTLIPNFLMVKGSIFPMPGPAEWKGSWLNQLPALTVPFMANAFSIFLLRQFFMKIPEEYWDAARLDGASHLRYLIQVVIPMSKAPIMTVVIFAFIGAWNAFLWPLLVTTNPTWRPLMVGLYTFVTEAGPETQLLMAGAVITLIPVLILYFLTQKQFTESIAASGLKG